MNGAPKTTLKSRRQTWWNKFIRNSKNEMETSKSTKSATNSKSSNESAGYAESCNIISDVLIDKIEHVKHQMIRRKANSNNKISEIIQKVENTTSIHSLLNISSTTNDQIGVLMEDVMDEKELHDLNQHYDDALKSIQILRDQEMIKLEHLNKTESDKLECAENDIICYEQQIKQIQDKLDELYEQKTNSIEILHQHQGIQEIYDNFHDDSIKQMGSAIDDIHDCEQKIHSTLDAEISAAINDKIEYFQKHYNEWTAQDVIAWFKFNMECFEQTKYHKLFDAIETLNVTGSELHEMKHNKLFFNMLGLNLDEQEIVMKCIKKLIIIPIVSKKKKSKNDEGNICGICVKNKINTVILPCGHLYYCTQCVDSNRNVMRSVCPICRRYVREIIQTFSAGFNNDNCNKN